MLKLFAILALVAGARADADEVEDVMCSNVNRGDGKLISEMKKDSYFKEATEKGWIDGWGYSYGNSGSPPNKADFITTVSNCRSMIPRSLVGHGAAGTQCMAKCNLGSDDNVDSTKRDAWKHALRVASEELPADCPSCVAQVMNDGVAEYNEVNGSDSEASVVSGQIRVVLKMTKRRLSDAADEITDVECRFVNRNDGKLISEMKKDSYFKEATEKGWIDGWGYSYSYAGATPEKDDFIGGAVSNCRSTIPIEDVATTSAGAKCMAGCNQGFEGDRIDSDARDKWASALKVAALEKNTSCPECVTLNESLMNSAVDAFTEANPLDTAQNVNGQFRVYLHTAYNNSRRLSELHRRLSERYPTYPMTPVRMADHGFHWARMLYISGHSASEIISQAPQKHHEQTIATVQELPQPAENPENSVVQVTTTTVAIVEIPSTDLKDLAMNEQQRLIRKWD